MLCVTQLLGCVCVYVTNAGVGVMCDRCWCVADSCVDVVCNRYRCECGVLQVQVWILFVTGVGV